MPFSAAAKTELMKASSDGVEDAFGNLRRYIERDRWLGLRNQYMANTIKKIDAHLATNPSSINQKHLVEYIASSVPLHAVDGWSYLGRALSAHLQGDVFAARHLGYYAELRAAMCILATRGIGVFNSRHFVVTSQSTAVKVPGSHSTHTFAWEALKSWASGPDSAKMLADVIRPYQQSIGDWLSGAPPYGSWAPQAKDWILKLGIDLDRAANDQMSRNEASYRPTRTVTPAPIDVRGSAEFAIALWLSLEPTPAGFERLDRHFLRRSFDEAYLSVSGRRPTPTSVPFAAAVETLLTGGAVAEPRRAYLGDFLRRIHEPEDLLLIRNAAVDSIPTAPEHHVHVLSRATLLLTIASLAARSVIQGATIDIADTQFWWGLLGVDRGLWATQPRPPELFDFWDDVQIELDDLQAWLDGGGDNRASLVADCPRSFARLSQMELVALWGIAG